MNDAWIHKINFEAPFSWDHLTQFVDLWLLIHNVQLQDEVEDSIVWKLMKNGQYSRTLAYKLQFLGVVHSDVNNIVWKAWAPPKVENHAWLSVQNSL
jgi:hypothetical protein